MAVQFPPVIRRDVAEIAESIGEHRSRLSGQTVLITGANGFLGAYLADAIAYLNESGALQSPCRICVLARDRSRLRRRLGHLAAAEYVREIIQDVTLPLPDTLGVTMVVHAASPASPQAYLATKCGHPRFRRYPGAGQHHTSFAVQKDICQLIQHDDKIHSYRLNDKEIFG